MTIYCYDTEFLEDGSTIELISIGIVCEDGRSYYAVNNDMDHKRISNNDWLMKNVVPHLPLNGKVSPGQFGDKPHWSLDTRSTLVKPKWVIANEVREFMLAGVEASPVEMSTYLPELWAYYGAYDHIALMQLWGPMVHRPKQMPMLTHDLAQLIEPLQGFTLPEQFGTAHNALDDAQWNYEVLLAARQHIAKAKP